MLGGQKTPAMESGEKRGKTRAIRPLGEMREGRGVPNLTRRGKSNDIALGSITPVSTIQMWALELMVNNTCATDWLPTGKSKNVIYSWGAEAVRILGPIGTQQCLEKSSGS